MLEERYYYIHDVFHHLLVIPPPQLCSCNGKARHASKVEKRILIARFSLKNVCTVLKGPRNEKLASRLKYLTLGCINYTVYYGVYHTPGDNIWGSKSLSPGVVYSWVVLYNAP